ncbi:MAG: HAD family hydrolase [Alphaproteobacteria bacterium]|nr:HAD family hydrolase [Alphaproteobacteria bacterium]MDD9920625.1 HAD family hydrolase [Alphaproteobacteria bacterium]
MTQPYTIPTDAKGFIVYDIDNTAAPTDDLIKHIWRTYLAKQVFNGDFTAAIELHEKVRNNPRHKGKVTDVLCAETELDKATATEEVYKLTSATLAEQPNIVPINPNTTQTIKALYQVGYNMGAITHARTIHATSVLKHMGVLQYFIAELVQGIDGLNFTSKAGKGTAYTKYQELYQLQNPEAQVWMLEDSPSNLIAAKKHGMTTVYIGTDNVTGLDYIDHQFPSITEFGKFILH